MNRSAIPLFGFALFGAACAMGVTPAQRVQDAANDYAIAIRFGRMDVALGRVSPDAREAFVRQHAAWGGNVRVVDCELLAMRLRDKEHADVALSVSWQKLDESEMRVTQVAQHWADHRGGWVLEAEERANGDAGLLGEQTTLVKPASGLLQFPTITIR
jgi:hypothetical protein